MKIKASVDGFEDAVTKFPQCVEAYALYAKVNTAVSRKLSLSSPSVLKLMLCMLR